MIKNLTNKKILVKRHKICKSIFSKALGLMFSKKIKDYGLVFEFEMEKRVSLHNFFVFFPIDVLFLGKDRRVVEVKKGFRPFTLYFPSRKAMYVVELPEGAVARTGTRVGDKIGF